MHKIFKIVDFSIDAPYTLKIYFDDGAEQKINFYPMLQGELFQPLKDLALFNQVSLDKDAHTVVWPNGADFDPAMLHDWPRHENEIINRAKNKRG